MADEVRITTNAAQVAVDFRKAADRTNTAAADVTTQWGMLLQTSAKRHASKPRSGPPGPRLITGNLVRTINRRTTRTAHGITVQVGTNAPQGRRLEFGFRGTDSLSRRYDQPPYPYLGPALDEVAPGFIAAVRGVVPKVLTP